MYELKVQSHFDAAHFLPWHEGKCKNLHGHRWEVEVVIEAEKLNENGIVVDFGVVKDILKDILPDHVLLNDMFDNPTAEVLARELFFTFKDRWEKKQFFVRDRGYGILLKELTVWESPKCRATYTPPSLPVVYEKKTDIEYPRDRAKKGGCCESS